MQTSKRSIRLHGISNETRSEDIAQSAADYLKVGQGLKASVSGFFRRSPAPEATGAVLGLSLAPQSNYQTATITYAKEKHKNNAYNNARKILERARSGPSPDDKFDGMTVLYSCPDSLPDTDICAVHGLNGNALDTWMGDSKMWLRDYLPDHLAFRHSRIMTYGYNSSLLDRGSIDMRLSNIADSMLLALGNLRSSAEEQSRPVIFICHSMGGIVARLAMTRYHKNRQKFEQVQLGRCGLLFLSTPNLGSMAANWSNFTIALAEAFVGVRSNLLDNLKALNPTMVDNVDDWASMSSPPIVRCFCESLRTGSHQVVTESSAGFLTDTAFRLPDTDHHTVCKFDTDTCQAFVIVMGALCAMRNQLLRFETPVPPINCASNELNPLLFDNGFRKLRANFVERSRILYKTFDINLDNANKKPSLVLTGMAGSGKTELLLKMATEESRRNVFVLSASNVKTLWHKLEEYACIIGHDLIVGRFPYADLHERWTSSLLILDDVETNEDLEEILMELPGTAQIAMSTRSPTVSRTLMQKKSCMQINVPVLEVEEAVKLITDLLTLTLITITPEQKLALVCALKKHPFALCAASVYLPHLRRFLGQTTSSTLVNRFLELLNEDAVEARKRFFDFDIRPDLSISKLFESTLTRIGRPITGVQKNYSIPPLIQICAFLSDEDCFLAFALFFDVLTQLEPCSIPEKLRPFRKGLMSEEATVTKALESSLFIEIDGIMYIPNLWRECIILNTCDVNERSEWLEQILKTCYFYFEESKDGGRLAAYVENCNRIMGRHRILHSDLNLQGDQREWFKSAISSPATRNIGITSENADGAKEES
ncbi:hypothetical protein DM02DRAFT_688675 [Periconia macrospinosa]|uniref:GPI inositol-deacylase n=1 Tax=Periconia macrospinosa TaxID=97972 RepID=A0A2V1DD43_9PLEO|nr:hypothetical protein DM02DRAFT_688675 [Periconia macrospinosa]